MLVAKTSKKKIWKQVLYIYYLISLKKDKIKALISFNIKINTIILAYIIKPIFKNYYTYIKD